MSVVIRIVGLVNGDACPFDDQYLVEYDPDREGVDPNGDPMFAHVVCTEDIGEAWHFDSTVEAWEAWKRTSARWPIRPDGQPNRPLTAFTVEIADPDA